VARAERHWLYNHRVIRRVTAVALVGLLQIGATSALLRHVHAEGDALAHQAGPSHAHLPGSGAAPHGAFLDHPDDGRAMAAQVFLAVAADPFAVPAAPPPAFTLVVPVERALGRPPSVSHAHDPPDCTVRPSRAPPALLS
jgi:hypothetical protein